MRNPNPALYKFKWKDYIMQTGLMDIYIYRKKKLHVK